MVQIKQKGVYGVENLLSRSFLGGVVRSEHKCVSIEMSADDQFAPHTYTRALLSTLTFALSTHKDINPTYLYTITFLTYTHLPIHP